MGGILGSILSGAIGQSLSAVDSNRQFQRQKYLLGLQNKFSEANMQWAASYNSPQRVFNRFKSLGMSPTAALQATTGNISPAQAVSSSSAPSVAGMNPGLKDIFGDIGMTAAQLENIKADTRSKNADAKRNEDTLTYDINNLIAQHDNFRAEYNKIQSEIGLTDSQKRYQDILNKYADKKSQEEINSIVTNYKKVLADTELVREEKKKLMWENFFRDNFGIDPHDDIMSQLVQASMHGDMTNVLNAIEKTAAIVWDKTKEWFNNLSNNINDKINEFNNNFKVTSPLIRKSLKNRFNPFSYGYGVTKNDGTKIFVSKLKTRNGKIIFR